MHKGRVPAGNRGVRAGKVGQNQRLRAQLGTHDVVGAICLLWGSRPGEMGWDVGGIRNTQTYLQARQQRSSNTATVLIMQ